MNRIPAAPEELDLESHGRRDYWVRLEHDSIWGEHLIPLTVLVGPQAESGRGMVLFGGTHGNDYDILITRHQLHKRYILFWKSP